MNMISAYKGIDPGKIIQNELNHRKITQREFAASIGEHYQTLCSIIKGHRGLSLETSIKLDKALGFEKGFFAIIQVYYKLKLLDNQQQSTPDKSKPKIRPVVFWDTNLGALDWQKNKEFIIARVLSRGNDEEKRQIKEYYGLE